MGLVLISHSGTLVDGLREMVMQVAGEDVAVATAGGTEDGRLGTSAPRIAEALRSTLDVSPEGVLVLFDLGSAALSLELAARRPRSRRSGSDTHQRSPAGRRRGPRRGPGQRRSVAGRGGGCRRGRIHDAQASAGSVMPELTLLVADPAGLHARPAARFVQAASRFESRIVLRYGGREADAKSLIALLGLTVRPSSEIVIAAEGPDADAAIAALAAELAPYLGAPDLVP